MRLVVILFLALVAVIVATGLHYTNSSLPNAAGLSGMATAEISSTVDFSVTTSVVNEYFYGTNTHGTWGAENSWIDTDGDGTRETPSDYEWHQDMLNAANIKYLRADMGLEWLATPPPQHDAQAWSLTTATFENIENSKTIADIPTTWSAESVRGTGVVLQTTDAHSGTYAVRIDNTASSGSVFSKRNVGTLLVGKTYEFSAWVKANGTVKLHIQRMDDWSSGCVATHAGDEQWHYMTCRLTPTSEVAKGWRLVIETRPNTWLIWDDVSFTQDGQVFYQPFHTLEKQRSLIKWAHENNIKVQYIASYMPLFLADTTAGCASKIDRCPPKDAQAYADLVVQFVDQVTEHGRYADAIEIEVWNEADLASFFMPDIDNNNPVRAVRYNEMYVAIYDAMKGAFPSIPVGGSGTSSVTTTNGRLIHASWLSANAKRQDFVSFHTYTHGDADKQIIPLLQQVDDDCQAAGASCDRILLDEWNVWSPDVKVNSSVVHEKQLALAYAGTLNYDPGRVQLVMYQWSESKKYQDGIKYPEYPQRWSMVSEPNLDNALYASYNVTKDFSTFHPAGSEIVLSKSANDAVRIVASITPSGAAAQKGSLANAASDPVYHVTLINGGQEQLFALVIGGIFVGAVKNAKTGESYATQNNGVAVLLAQNQILHLELTRAVVAPVAPAVIESEIVFDDGTPAAPSAVIVNDTNQTALLATNDTNQSLSNSDLFAVNENSDVVGVPTSSSGGGVSSSGGGGSGGSSGGGSGGSSGEGAGSLRGGSFVASDTVARDATLSQSQRVAVALPAAQEQPSGVIAEYYIDETQVVTSTRSSQLLAPFTGSKEFLVLVSALTVLLIAMTLARYKQ